MGSVSVGEAAELLVMFVVLLMSCYLIFSGIRLADRLRRGDYVRISGGLDGNVAAAGTATAVLAALCIAAGVFLLYQAMTMYNGGGPSDDSSADGGTTSLSATLLAAGEPQEEGWAYVGRSSAPQAGSAPQAQGPFATVIDAQDVTVMQTTASVPLFGDHYERFTGSLVGALLGYREPDRSGRLPSGACVSVSDWAIVGNGHVWLEVEQISSDVCDQLASEVEGLHLGQRVR